jgi:twitching motility two-component system response regulator PilH
MTTILIMEDDHFFQNFYSQKLTEKGYQVEVAADGEAGMKLVQEKKPGLILLDIIMPKKDGFQVLEELAKDPVLKNIPVLVFSTLGQEADMIKAKTLGAKDYINKSFFDFDNLSQKIASYLK